MKEREKERGEGEEKEREERGKEREKFALPQGTNNRVSQACPGYTRARTRFHRHKSMAAARGAAGRGGGAAM